MTTVPCFCSPARGFTCLLHRGDAKPDPVPVDRFSLTCPWNPEDLPEYLRGYGHHTGWSANMNGEWILPEEDKEGEFMRAVGILFEVSSEMEQPTPA